MNYDVHRIEPYWQNQWKEKNVFSVKLDTSKPKFYCLEMFPYPSGNMHMGHVRNYSIGDAMARFQRLMGKNVLYPMGYDSFGMPAENAAKKEGGHPHDVTERNIKMIRTDQERMGYSYDWNRTFATSTPEYYRWNQELFIRFYEAGLVERRVAPVNWCNDCDTVLANEQVKNNRCWRCGLEVIQKDMAQWFLRMTKYADELLDDLDNINFPENVKAMQRNWIGRSQGAHIDFPVVGGESVIGVFTTRPDTIFGVTFVTLSPEHPLCESFVSGTEYEEGWKNLRDECAKMSEFERINMLKEKKGIPLGRFAINPLSGEQVPIYAGNFVVASYGTGAVMAVPGHDQRDYDFAKKYNLPIKPVLSRTNDENAIEENPVFDGLGYMTNSSREGFDGLFGNEAKEAVIAVLESEKSGYGTVQYRLKDWLLSRQRFWGTPIPMLHCDDCGVVPVPYQELPVRLPLDVKFSWDESGNPLASNEKFLMANCPQCGNQARRETDTMDTFYDSSWYFLRYGDSNNEDSPFNREIIDYWMEGGIDLYIGGIEHAVMHLLYARFFTKATRDLGMNTTGEPFGQLVCQGMLNAPAPFCIECNIEYHIDNFDGNCPSCKSNLTTRQAKMSKSLGNTVSPGIMVDKYGADTVRLFILFGANPEAGMDWSDNAIVSNHRQMQSIIEAFESSNKFTNSPNEIDEWILARMRFNHSRWKIAMENVSLREGVMISHFEMLSDWQWYRRRGGSDASTAKIFFSNWIPMLAPATPHIAEEFWSKIGGKEMISELTINDLDKNRDDTINLAKESYLRALIDSSRNVKGLAQRHSDTPISSCIIQTAASWKNNLASEAISLSKNDFDFRKSGAEYLRSLEIFSEEKLRGEIFQAWQSFTLGNKKNRGKIYTWSEGETSLISSKFDESELINNNATFIANALSVDSVVSYKVGDGEDVAGKARVASPLEPGIAFI
jgi:leucyl-tRNA synthetase